MVFFSSRSGTEIRVLKGNIENQVINEHVLHVIYCSMLGKMYKLLYLIIKTMYVTLKYVQYVLYGHM